MAKLFSSNTTKAMASDLLIFCRTMEHLGGWQNVNPKHMLDYIRGDMLQTRNYQANTIERRIEHLKAFYAWLVKSRHLDHTPQFNRNFRHLKITRINRTNIRSTMSSLQSTQVLKLSI